MSGPVRVEPDWAASLDNPPPTHTHRHTHTHTHTERDV